MIPFGNTTATGAANANAYQYTGRENEGNGLYFYRARYFNSVLGRFITEDPAGFKASGVNVYAYAGDNPINFRDSTGLARDCFATGCGGLPGVKPESLAGRKQDAKWWNDFFWDMFHHDWRQGNTGKNLCFLEFLGTTAEAMNPFDFAVDNPKDWTELGGKLSSLTLNNIAFIHAANAKNMFGFSGLIYPNKSSVVQELTEASETLETASPFLAFDVAAFTKGLPAEWDAAKGGTCDPTFF
ncbi:MAG TPA: RHS repeat-associated core domain-containing protein [Candidatus Angelobacter sp.]|jgi:RHS repeat-associated protein